MEYKIKPNGFQEIQKKIIFRTVPMSLFAASVGIYIAKSNNSSINENDFDVLPYAVPLIFVFLGYSLYKGIKRQRSLFESYKLTINDENIIREQLNTSSINLPINQISKISKLKDGTITIIGRNKSEMIIVPVQIEKYDEIESKLNAIIPLKVIEKEKLLEKYSSVTGLITIGLMVCVYTLTNKIIVGVSGSLLLGILLWSFIVLRKNKNLDEKTKKGVWWIIIVLISIIGVMFLKLTN